MASFLAGAMKSMLDSQSGSLSTEDYLKLQALLPIFPAAIFAQMLSKYELSQYKSQQLFMACLRSVEEDGLDDDDVMLQRFTSFARLMSLFPSPTKLGAPAQRASPPPDAPYAASPLAASAASPLAATSVGGNKRQLSKTGSSAPPPPPPPPPPLAPSESPLFANMVEHLLLFERPSSVVECAIIVEEVRGHYDSFSAMLQAPIAHSFAALLQTLSPEEFKQFSRHINSVIMLSTLRITSVRFNKGNLCQFACKEKKAGCMFELKFSQNASASNWIELVKDHDSVLCEILEEKTVRRNENFVNAIFTKDTLDMVIKVGCP
jgi:hypothetical protein